MTGSSRADSTLARAAREVIFSHKKRRASAAESAHDSRAILRTRRAKSVRDFSHGFIKASTSRALFLHLCHA
jgi:hypothetical protein